MRRLAGKRAPFRDRIHPANGAMPGADRNCSDIMPRERGPQVGSLQGGPV